MMVDPRTKFRRGSDFAGRCPVRVSTARRNLYLGYVRSVDADVVVIENPRSSAPFTIAIGDVVSVAPLPAGAKI